MRGLLGYAILVAGSVGLVVIGGVPGVLVFIVALVSAVALLYDRKARLLR